MRQGPRHNIGTSETMHANGLGGNDTITVGEVGAYEVTGAGGAGNDMLAGAGASETFLGGSGNDTITPGGAIDIASGDASTPVGGATRAWRGTTGASWGGEAGGDIGLAGPGTSSVCSATGATKR